MKTFGDLKVGDVVNVIVCGECLFPSEHVLKVYEVKDYPDECVYLKFNENIDISVNRDNLVVKKSQCNWTTIPTNLCDLYVRVSTE